MTALEKLCHDLDALTDCRVQVERGNMNGSTVTAMFNGDLTRAEMSAIERHFGAACRGIVNRRAVTVETTMRWVKVVQEV